MAKLNLHTSTPIQDSFQELASSELRLPLSPSLNAVVKKKALVAKGGLIAENPVPGAHGLGFLHAPMDCQVADVTSTHVVLQIPPPPPEPKEGEEAPAAPVFERPEKVDPTQFKGEELCRKLMELGVDTRKFRPAKALVVNALNPEPGVTTQEQILKDFPQVLEMGLVLIERIVNPANIYLVSAPGVNAKLHGCHMVEASDKYPATMAPLVQKKATGSEKPDGVTVITLQDVYDVGRVAETQMPLTETFLTIGRNNYRAPVGMPIQEALEKAGVASGSDTQVILGGPMRGTAIFDLIQGLPKDCAALTLVPQGAFPPVADNPCTMCGECNLVCPVRIQPGMISRYAEFNMFDQALKLHIDVCIECGMCGFVCPANRPMLQYIRLAKQELLNKELMLTACRLPE